MRLSSKKRKLKEHLPHKTVKKQLYVSFLNHVERHMRKINKIIIHCSATREGESFTVDDIRKWHVEDNGWNDIGYHYVIYLDGSIHDGRDESVTGAHTSGQNAHSIGVCYIGGMDKDNIAPKDTRTTAQKVALLKIIRALREKYPNATIHGHREFANKACPSFDVAEYRYIDPPSPEISKGPEPVDYIPAGLSDFSFIGRFFKWLFSWFK